MCTALIYCGLSLVTMSLRFFLTLALLTVLTQARPEKPIKECKNNDDCNEGFTCMKVKKSIHPICARKKTEDVHVTESTPEEDTTGIPMSYTS